MTELTHTEPTHTEPADAVPTPQPTPPAGGTHAALLTALGLNGDVVEATLVVSESAAAALAPALFEEVTLAWGGASAPAATPPSPALAAAAAHFLELVDDAGPELHAWFEAHVSPPHGAGLFDASREHLRTVLREGPRPVPAAAEALVELDRLRAELARLGADQRDLAASYLAAKAAREGADETNAGLVAELEARETALAEAHAQAAAVDPLRAELRAATAYAEALQAELAAARDGGFSHAAALAQVATALGLDAAAPVELVLNRAGALSALARVNLPALVAVASERARQLAFEGYDPGHDDLHEGGQLALAASAYAWAAGVFARTHGSHPVGAPHWWPFEPSAFATVEDPRRALERAGALVLAEWERLQRAQASAPQADPLSDPAGGPDPQSTASAA